MKSSVKHNEKLLKFVQCYTTAGTETYSNATRSAQIAGYSAKTAYSSGQRLLKHPEVKKLLDEIRQKTADNCGITRERVLLQYANIAFFDIRKIFTEAGALKPINELGDDAGAAVVSVEVDELFEFFGDVKVKIGETKKVKVGDRKSALDSICKVLGYNAPDKVESTNKDESLAGMENLTSDEKLMLFKLKQKMRGATPVSGTKAGGNEG